MCFSCFLSCLTDKNQPHSGGEAISQLQKQTQDANVSTLIASISKLEQEKKQLLSEKAELLAKLAATKGTTSSFSSDIRWWRSGSERLLRPYDPLPDNPKSY